ncbi:hypothetical protein FRC00_007115, partial [Tulasnella sp. 408]
MFGGWLHKRGFKGVTITLVLGLCVNLAIYHDQVTVPWTRSPNARPPALVNSTSGSLFANSGRVTGPVTSGRVVVTGGAGNIGKNLIYRLLAGSTPVTVIDRILYQDEVDGIYEELPPARELLSVTLGDIRDASTLQKVMTPDVVGVIHLAAVSRVDWCEKNTVDCLDVNERGTEIVLEALANLNRHDNGQRWFILASSAEVYGNTSHKVPQNAFEESKLRAEQVVERYVEGVQKDDGGGSLYAINLRLATVYGGAFDIVERLVPSLVNQAIAHQVIQIEGGEQQLDLIHIDDAVDAFLLAAEHLSRFQNDPSLKRTRTFIDTFNIASGTTTPVGDLLDKILRLTRSKSPIRHIPMDTRFPAISSANTEKTRNKLNFQASLSLDQGLLQFVKLLLTRNERALRKKIDTECGAASPTIKANGLPEMYKLNNCQAHVHALVRGELAVVGLPENAGNDTRWHVESRFPPYILHTFVKGGPNGKPWLGISDDHSVYFGIKRSAVPPTQGRVKVERIDRDGIDAGDYMDWEMEVNAEKGTLKLVLPDTSLQLKPPISPGGDFHL